MSNSSNHPVFQHFDLSLPLSLPPPSDVPNAGEGLKRLAYRQEWDVDFRAYLKALDAKKPLVLCGDLNVAHEEIGEEGRREGGRRSICFTFAIILFDVH